MKAMFSALDCNGNLIDIDTAIQYPPNKYFCPSCHEELVIKSGNVRLKHFAHKIKSDCEEFDNDMSEWHRNWQKKFPIKNREVVLKVDEDNPFAEHLLKTTHRADVLCYGYAIEFQNSPISSKEFNERNYFYYLLRKKVIWIFNMIDLYERDTIECYGEWYDSKDNGGKYNWKYASKTFINFKSFDEDIILIFQINDNKDDEKDSEQCYFERVIWAININNDEKYTDFKRFFTSYSISNFSELMSKIRRKEL
ncbi:competence protein CoiA [Clostridium beijerinckii]|uniref:competence protein CoiA n=1 Tax=Clostridium beijerinckii TaxID=1520 RepID=UPI0022E0F6DE|nr:competence protein CoiA family protein [Clostridium beijerinckii]